MAFYLRGKRQTKLMFGCRCAVSTGVDRIDERYGAFQCPDGHTRSSPVARRAESADGWVEPGPVFDKAMSFERQDHLVYGRRRDVEVLLHFGPAGGHPWILP